MNKEERNSFGYLLSTCNNQLIKLLNRELAAAKLELTREQYIVLNNLWTKDSVSQQSIANTLGKDKYSITKLIDGLEKRKLVKRVASPNDKRVKLIEVMTKGIEIRPMVIRVVEATIHKATQEIPEQDLELTKATLRKIIMNVSSFHEFN